MDDIFSDLSFLFRTCAWFIYDECDFLSNRLETAYFYFELWFWSKNAGENWFEMDQTGMEMVVFEWKGRVGRWKRIDGAAGDLSWANRMFASKSLDLRLRDFWCVFSVTCTGCFEWADVCKAKPCSAEVVRFASNPLTRKASLCSAKVVDYVSNPPSHEMHEKHTKTRKIDRSVVRWLYIGPSPSRLGLTLTPRNSFHK